MTGKDPEIRVRDPGTDDKKDERKKAVPLFPWFPAAPKGTLFAWFRDLVSTEAGLLGLALTVAATGSIASYCAPKLRDALFGPKGGGVMFQRAPSDEEGEPYGMGEEGSSLQFLNDANRGALADGAAGASGSGKTEEEKGPEEGSFSGEGEAVSDWDEAIQAAAEAEGAKAGKRRPRMKTADPGSFGSKGGGFVPGASMGPGGGKLPTAKKPPGVDPSDRRLLRDRTRSRRLTAVRRGRGKGLQGALAQLRHTAKISRAGQALQHEAASAAETAAFENAGGGQPTEGEGISEGGVGQGTPDSAPAANANRDIKETPPPVGDKSDKTPYRKSMMLAMMLLMMADAMLLMAAYLAHKNPSQVLSFGLSQPMAAMLAQGAILLSLVVVGIGFGIMNRYGQVQQGQILMLSGGLAAGLATAALALGKHQPLLLALAGLSSGLVAAMGMSMQSKDFGF